MNAIREQHTNIKDLLREHIGSHNPKKMPVKLVSELTGISKRTIDGHLSVDGSTPNADHMTAYLSVLPDSFVGAYLAKSRITHHRMRPGHKPFSLIASAGLIVSSLGEAYADGIIDHQERLSLRPQLFEHGSAVLSAAVTL